jgi:hypothetical protein
MAQITFTIPDAKLPRVVAAIKNEWQIPKDANGDPLFTDNQWAKEAIRRYIVALVKKYEGFVALDAVAADDTIAT